MKVLIHAYPKRMWYVEEFIIPSLLEQGLPAEDIEVWNDTEGKGNLQSCMESFGAREGDGGTWHIQDDVILCRDFVERCKALDKDNIVMYGFACEKFHDGLDQRGLVYQPSSWHSFQCVRIPDAYARECADWFFSDASERFIFSGWKKTGKMDDSFFWSFMEDRHPGDMVRNIVPNLVDHVDWCIGGSAINEWRGWVARSDFWNDEELVDNLIEKLNERA